MIPNSQLQTSVSLTNPLVTLSIQVLISAITIAISVLVARRYGGIAASKFSLTEARRKEHTIDLVDEPLQQLIGSLRYIEGVLGAWYTPSGVISTVSVDVFQGATPKAELLFSHLKSGYHDLYESILAYQESYNGLAARSLAAYRNARERLEKVATEQPFQWENNLSWTVQALSSEMTFRLARGNQPTKATFDSKNLVRLGGSNIAKTESESDGNKIASAVNAVLDDAQFLGELQAVWKNALDLEGKRKQIEKELQTLRDYGHAGVYLKGSCSAGVQAKFEKV